jgi:hypothetical protein
VLDNQPTTTLAYETAPSIPMSLLSSLLTSLFSEQTPFLVISPTSLLIDYGDSLELICQTNLISPSDIQWLHNGHSVDNVQYLTHFYDRNILRINKAIDEHTGIYQCFANNSLGQQFIMSSPVTVTVRRKNGTISIFRSMYYLLLLDLAHPDSHDRAVAAGHRLTLSCEIGSEINGNFLGTIEWFHNGLPLKINPDHRNHIDYRNGTLIIEQTSVRTRHLVLSSSVRLCISTGFGFGRLQVCISKWNWYSCGILPFREHSQ